MISGAPLRVFLATMLAREVILNGLSGSNSVVESRLPKPLVAGSIPVSRSIQTGDSLHLPGT